MTKEESKILNEFLVKTLKVTEEQLAQLYNEAGELQGLQVAYDADASRVKQFGIEKTNQYNRGLKEGASKIEKEIKAKYELESEAIGVELVDQIVLSKVEEATKTDKKDISKHPEMTKARLEWEKEQKKRDEDWQKKLDAKDVEFAQVKLKETVRSKGLIYLDEFKPVLNPDPVKASHWKDVYLNELLSYKFQNQDNDDPVILGEDGQPLKDAHGYVRKLKELSKEISGKYFDPVKAEERSSPGNKDIPGQQSGTFAPPKNNEEYEKRLKNPAITPKERIELVNWYNNQT